MPDGISNNNYPPEYKFYKVAFSYSTKQIDFVRKVAELLSEMEGMSKEAIFFDKWESDFAGSNLDLKLETIYGYRAEYIVPFLSNDYDNSKWTKIERDTIREVQKHISDEIILAARFDKNQRKDFSKNYKFIECSKKEEYVAKAIYQRMFNSHLPARKLWHVNNLVSNIEEEIPGWGVAYIDIRDIFEDIEKEKFPVSELKEYIPIWKTNEDFPSSKLNLKPVYILDYLCDYSKESNYKALLQFLCVFCNKIETSKIVNINLILDKVFIASDYLGHDFDSLCDVSSPTTVNFPFTNREKELKKVLENFFPYQLITAPKQYGKSFFLNKLQESYKAEGLIAYNCEITQLKDLDSADTLSMVLGFSSKENLVDTVCKYLKDIIEKGLVFIFDVEQIIAASQLKVLRLVFEEIRTALLTRIERENDEIELPANQIKLVVSCPHLSGKANSNTWPYSYDITSLSEFDHSVILSSLKEYISLKSKEKSFKKLKTLTPSDIESVAAKITLMSAGHPQVVSSMAKSYCSRMKLSIPQTIAEIDGIAGVLGVSIPNPVIKNLFTDKKIPLFRYINDNILAEIMHAGIVERRDIFDKIISHNLYQEYPIDGEKTRLLRDSLLRRTCAIDYCYSQPDEFIKACSKTMGFYHSCISECSESLNIRMLFLIEYWFSILQKKLASFSLKQSDFNLHVVDFFDETNVFDDIAQLFSCEIKIDIALFKKRLTDFLDQDDEFQLLLNYKIYQLDTKCINKDHYLNLLKLIDSFQG